MKVFEYYQDVDRFCPWDPEDESFGRIRDHVPIGTPAAGDWRPLRGALRPISGLAEGDFPFWLDPVMSGRAREGLADLLDPWGEWLPLEVVDRVAELGLRGLAPRELWDSELGSRYIGVR